MKNRASAKTLVRGRVRKTERHQKRLKWDRYENRASAKMLRRGRVQKKERQQIHYKGDRYEKQSATKNITKMSEGDGTKNKESAKTL